MSTCLEEVASVVLIDVSGRKLYITGKGDPVSQVLVFGLLIFAGFGDQQQRLQGQKR